MRFPRAVSPALTLLAKVGGFQLQPKFAPAKGVQRKLHYRDGSVVGDSDVGRALLGRKWLYHASSVVVCRRGGELQMPLSIAAST